LQDISALKKGHKYIVLTALLLPCLFIEACSCSCSSDKSGARGVRGSAREKLSTLKVSAEKFTGSFAAYLNELRVIESQTRLQSLKQIAQDQKSASLAFSRGSDKNSLLEDSTGKFKFLEPLVRENKVNEIIAELKRIVRENENDRPVLIEAHRKLSLCYYLTGDHLKCSGHTAKYNSLLDEQIEQSDKITEELLENYKKGVDY